MRNCENNYVTVIEKILEERKSKYLECEHRQLGLSAIATYIFKPSTEKFKIGR